MVVTIPSELILLAEQRPEALLKNPPKPDPSAAYFRAVWRALLLGAGDENALAEGKRVADRLGAKVYPAWPKQALELRMAGDYNRVAFDRVDPTGWHMMVGRCRFEGEPELCVRRERVVNVYVNRPHAEQQKPDVLELEAKFLGVLALECVPTPDRYKPVNEAMVHLRTRPPGGPDHVEHVAVVRGGGAYFDVKQRLLAIAETYDDLLKPAGPAPEVRDEESEATDG